MFRPGNKTPDLPDSVKEAGVADGFVHLCQQQALVFGGNRRTPVAARPVVAVKRHGPRMVVLPCTTRDQSNSPDFFDLNEKQRVMWSHSRNEERHSFAYYRYEAVDPVFLLQDKIGVMSQASRIELLNWLKSRY